MTQKNGKRNRKQRYHCNKCKYNFEIVDRSKKALRTKIFKQYAQQKQTYSELAKRFGLSERTIRRQIDKVEVQKPVFEGGDAVIAMDTTYFGRDFGVMVFREMRTHRNIHWQFVRHETLEEYVSGIKHLESKGWKILGIVCDGKRGLFSAFGNTPVQMCQFHQTAIIRRYLTNSPKLDAGNELKSIVETLPKCGKEEFVSLLDAWHKKWKDFLAEKTHSSVTGGWFYTHRTLRSAFRSLKTNIPYLFTYLDHPELNIPNTTNSLESIFSQIKKKIRVHPGLKIDRKIKIIKELLNG